MLALFLFYGCTGGPMYGPQGRLIFLPLAQVSGISLPDFLQIRFAPL